MKAPWKQVLSLALCGAVLTGALALGAGAADAGSFTDAKSVTHWQAVAALAKLDVISGKEDGSFDPGGAVTRAEAAKMAALLVTGGETPWTDPDFLPSLGAGPSYPDIAGHWAQPYIEYATVLGLFSGREDGSFDPDGLVTGSELARVVLVGLGYDSVVWGLVGPDWEINTNAFANAPEADLFAGLDAADPSLPYNRENTAQLLYNALGATVMEKTRDGVLSTGEVTYKYVLATDGAGAPVTLLQSRFHLDQVTDLPAQPV